jgi:hypothetical protein
MQKCFTSFLLVIFVSLAPLSRGGWQTLNRLARIGAASFTVFEGCGFLSRFQL